MIGRRWLGIKSAGPYVSEAAANGQLTVLLHGQQAMPALGLRQTTTMRRNTLIEGQSWPYPGISHGLFPPRIPRYKAPDVFPVLPDSQDHHRLQPRLHPHSSCAFLFEIIIMSVEHLKDVAQHVLECLQDIPDIEDYRLVIIGHLAIGRQRPGFESFIEHLLRTMQNDDRYAVEILFEQWEDDDNHDIRNMDRSFKRQWVQLRPTEFRVENGQLRYHQYTQIKFHFLEKPHPRPRTNYYLHAPLVRQIIGEMRHLYDITDVDMLPYASTETSLAIMVARCTKGCLLPGESSRAIAKEVEALLNALASHNRTAQRGGVRVRCADQLQWTTYHKRSLFSCLGKLQELLSWRGPEGRKELKWKLNID
ncbi:hypothetical protein BP00DRAFT_38006 [Aspergillus indologenus CBS 114.80]|uniref:Uncharacterized protein n=1 Tax=Aspergillus indologenus CBS 114.80 TaxID=1450541 RepID=A0A2V5IEL5_9EURO|nr:hypothetical protein BP00DRAFT_38006 [Aspergillus indologenus CBS 114.80]